MQNGLLLRGTRGGRDNKETPAEGQSPRSQRGACWCTRECAGWWRQKQEGGWTWMWTDPLSTQERRGLARSSPWKGTKISLRKGLTVWTRTRKEPVGRARSHRKRQVPHGHHFSARWLHSSCQGWSLSSHIYANHLIQKDFKLWISV